MTEHSPALAGARRRGVLLAGACSGFLLIGATFALVGTTLPSLSDSFGVSVTRAGVLFSAQSFGFLTMVFFGGITSDVIGQRLTVLCGLGLVAAALLAFAFAPGWLAAVALMVCVGLGFGLAEVGMNASIADAFAEKRAWALNLIHMFFGVGALVAPALVGFTSRWDVDWRWFYVGVAVWALAPWMLLIRAPFLAKKREERPPLKGTLGYLLRQRRFLLIAAFLGLYVAAEGTTVGWCFTFLVEVRNHSEAFAGLALSLFWVGIVAGRMVSTWIVERVDYTLLILVGSGAGFAALMVVLATGHPVAVAAAYTCTGFSFAPMFATILALGQRSYPRATGMVSGLIITVGGIGGAVFPWLAGQLSEAADLRLAVLIGGALALLLAITAAALIGWDRGHHTQRRERQA